MDQSYWSRPEVVAATRDFVCVRLATYEDKEEVRFLEKIYRGRSGKLENTVFAILDSDGKTLLSRAGRSPDFAFRGPDGFILGLHRIANERKLSTKRFSDAELPLVKNVDLGLNVASCGGIQLLVVTASSQKSAEMICKKLLPLAWNDKLGGQFVFAIARDAKQLKPIGLNSLQDGFLVVEPGQFGMSGKMVARFGKDFDTEQVRKKLEEQVRNYSVTKDYRQHIDLGISLGIEWNTETPVTDQQSLRALERSRGIRNGKD